MPRRFIRDLKYNRLDTIKALIGRGIDPQSLVNQGTGIKEGERVIIADTEYIAKEKGRLERLGKKEVEKKEIQFVQREFIDIPKKLRKGKTLEQIREMRPAPVAHYEDVKLTPEIKNDSINAGSLSDQLIVDAPDAKKIMQEAMNFHTEEGKVSFIEKENPLDSKDS